MKWTRACWPLWVVVRHMPDFCLVPITSLAGQVIQSLHPTCYLACNLLLNPFWKPIHYVKLNYFHSIYKSVIVADSFSISFCFLLGGHLIVYI